MWYKVREVQAVYGSDVTEKPVVDEVREMLRDVQGGPAMRFGYSRDERRWILRDSEHVFAFPTLADAVDVLAVAFDTSGGEYTEFARVLRSFGVCKARRIA